MALRAAMLASGLALALGAPAEASTSRFIERMIAAVDAREVPCEPLVVVAAEARSLRAVCADFEGGFSEFRRSWDERVRIEETEPAAGAPRVKAQTDWDSRDGRHERIYTVGRSVVGVRFDRGAILFVRP